MFSNNQASYGGGIRGENANLLVSNCEFHDNKAAYYAGAIYILVVNAFGFPELRWMSREVNWMSMTAASKTTMSSTLLDQSTPR